MIEGMLGFLVYFFSNPSIVGICLALIFGAFWLAIYRPPVRKEPWLWAVMGGGAVLIPIAIAIAAFPVSIWITQFYKSWLGEQVFSEWLLLAGLLPLLIAGLVRIGLMLLPVVVFWWYKGRNIEPSLGLAAGAVAGAGAGILAAQWKHDYILASGFTWATVQSQGVIALSAFWGSFFEIGWHIGVCALAGWGLAKDKGWQFYLLASFLYVLFYYTEYLVAKELVEPIVAYMIIAAWALLVTGVALWLSGRKEKSKAGA